MYLTTILQGRTAGRTTSVRLQGVTFRTCQVSKEILKRNPTLDDNPLLEEREFAAAAVKA
jgi:hypothetical protein